MVCVEPGCHGRRVLWLSGHDRPKPSNEVISGWKTKPQQVAKQMMVKYGPPNEVTTERLIWHDNEPWKQTELVNEEIRHMFPKPHKDMLYQTINYRVLRRGDERDEAS